MGAIREVLNALRGKDKRHPWHFIEVFADVSGQYRWRKRSRQNRQIVATSHQSFHSASNAVRGALDGNRDMSRVDVTLIRAHSLGERITLDPATIVTGVPAEPWTSERPTRFEN